MLYVAQIKRSTGLYPVAREAYQSKPMPNFRPHLPKHGMESRSTANLTETNPPSL